MDIETLSNDRRRGLYEAHKAMTQAALVQVFGQTEEKAAMAVRDLWERYAFAPQREQDLLIHNDPVALACDLAEEKWSDISKERLDKFNRSRARSMKAGLGIL